MKGSRKIDEGNKKRQNKTASKNSFLGGRRHSFCGRDGLIHGNSKLKQICCHNKFIQGRERKI